MGMRQSLASSNHWAIALARRARRGPSLPVPRIVARALVGIFVPIRSLYFTCLRVFIAEPLFKGYCKEYGKNLRTDGAGESESGQ